MEKLLIQNARVITERCVLPPSDIYCEGGRVMSLNASPSETARAERCVDAEGRLLAPGYIDLHIHGLAGRLADDGPEALGDICRALPRYGVTGFLPTITPCAEDVARLTSLAGAWYEGSEILGFFLEGHYLRLAGALSELPADYSLQKVEALREAAGRYRLAFGVSPEIEELLPLLPLMTRDGFPAFITHTAATAEQTERFIEGGARHATHFYDVFPHMGEREPGVRGCGTVEAILAHREATVDFILDGEHVEPMAVRMALACKGEGGVCLITDANVNAGMPPGRYTGIGGTEVQVAYPGGPARMAEQAAQPGALVGSGLTMDRAVQNAVRMLGQPVHLAVRMASLNPAAVLGLDRRKGRIAPGYDIDFSLLEEDLSVTACFIGGRMVFGDERELETGVR